MVVGFIAAAASEIYTLSLHDALPIFHRGQFAQPLLRPGGHGLEQEQRLGELSPVGDRKSTRLNSSHMSTSYSDFFLKKKTEPKDGEELLSLRYHSHCAERLRWMHTAH